MDHEIIIRPIRDRDAPAFLELQRQLDSETNFMMLEPGERITTPEETRQRILSLREKPYQIILVADAGGKLVGFLGAYGGEYRRNRATVYLVVGVLQAYAGKGLGRRLFVEMETWARQSGAHRLELTVMTHNQSGISLYQKMGFEIEGVKKDSLRVDGKYVDEYYMAKLL